MPKSRQRGYSNLRFRAGVNWQKVDPKLLQAINRIAREKHFIVDIVSGWRSSAHSVAVGGFANDPHTRGIAVDAYVNGRPIGQVVSSAEWASVGIESGNTPNFYKGKPDPEHLQLDDTSGYAVQKATASRQPRSRRAPQLGREPNYGPVDEQAAQGFGGQTSFDQEGAFGLSPYQVADVWQQLATAQFASPETRTIASNAASLMSNVPDLLQGA